MIDRHMVNRILLCDAVSGIFNYLLYSVALQAGTLQVRSLGFLLGTCFVLFEKFSAVFSVLKKSWQGLEFLVQELIVFSLDFVHFVNSLPKRSLGLLRGYHS